MKLRVKAGTVELPYKVKNHEFAPDAEVSDELGAGLLKTYPDIFEKASGNPDLEKYTFKPTFQVNEIQKVLDQLTEDQRLNVYEYAKKLLEKPIEPDPKEPKQKEPRQKI